MEQPAPSTMTSTARGNLFYPRSWGGSRQASRFFQPAGWTRLILSWNLSDKISPAHSTSFEPSSVNFSVSTAIALKLAAVSDVVVRGEVPDEVRRSMEMWVGCIAGALPDHEYIGKLAKAGFDAIDIEPTRIYSVEDARHFLTGEGIDVNAIAPQLENKFMSAFIRAIKPAAKPSPEECCGPACCS